MPDSKKIIDRLNSLLQGEIAAVETYNQALTKVENTLEYLDLQVVQDDHLEAVDYLRNHIGQFGGKAVTGSGIWGAWAQSVEGTATLLGDGSALRVLKEGEEHGVKEYEKALKDENLPAPCKNLILDMLLPRQQAHVDFLKQLIAYA